MADLLIKVGGGLARQLNRYRICSENELGRTLARYGARLSRFAQGGGELAQFFEVEQVAGDRMDALRQDLAGLPEVEAAYIKPKVELP